MTETAVAPALRWAWLGTVGYAEALALQRAIAAARRSGELVDDAVLLLEHPPVYTMGRQGEARHLRDGPAALIEAGAEFVEADRGGSVTFHGPGQLVAYPVVRLAGLFPIPGHPAHGDVIRYLRALESALIATAAAYGVGVTRRPPFTGVWSGDRKLGAIGVKLAGGVTTHGVAMNVATDLSWFDRIVPCGIDGSGVASLETLGAPGQTPERVAPVLAGALATAFGLRLEPVGSLAAQLARAVPSASAA
ncbi:MAG TPA: lipoyl(octanoyl) transferase LipB [Candidatus Acidoferrales bacterium]|nr:lipoyl(octanoyl) transferase LipB [Candidatus Acidoferrales bacterium]